MGVVGTGFCLAHLRRGQAEDSEPAEISISEELAQPGPQGLPPKPAPEP